MSGPLSKLTHHFKGTNSKVLRIYPMLRTLLQDVEDWNEKDPINREFNEKITEQDTHKIAQCLVEASKSDFLKLQ